MNNVIKLRPRQRFRYRTWANRSAAGTSVGACVYVILVSFWPALFLHWIGGLFVVAAALMANGAALAFRAQKVRCDREEARRLHEWRLTQAEFQRKVRAQEAAQLRASMEAPTVAIPLLRQRPRDVLTDGLGSPLGRLWDELTEPTGDIIPLRDRRTA